MTNFPNLALMKISKVMKDRGHSVEWYDPLVNASNPYNEVYSSSVFSFSKKDQYLPKDTIRGGTGYGLFASRHFFYLSKPDYSIYPNFKHALGFCTRGCIRECPWCIVPRKEGKISFDTAISAICDGKKSVVLMDNNFLAHSFHYSELHWCVDTQTKIDFNQGLDARLVNEENSDLLARCKWIRFVRFSCDRVENMDSVARAVTLLRNAGLKNEIMCYVLVQDIEQALEVCLFLKSINVQPFAQAFIDYSGTDKRTVQQKRFCRWVNCRGIFNTVRWEDYTKK